MLQALVGKVPSKGGPLDVCDVGELGAMAVSPKSKNNGTGNGPQTVGLWLTTAFNNTMIMEFVFHLRAALRQGY